MRKATLLLLLALFCLPARAVGPLPAAGTVEVLFTPWEDAEGALLRVIGQARHSIHVQAYSFTSRNIGWALGEAKRRGVKVEVLADHESSKNRNSLVDQLHDAGIPVWFEVRYAAAHNKVMIVDGEGPTPIVVTGSYNFSFSAQARNSENLILFRGNVPLARAYLDNWRRHRAEAVALEK
ncbi:MAG: phospholipase D family protein [Rhodocyclaceae bacterium]|nr:phospholipase D family protein [Rhodocyclaceae bacterium]